MKPIQVALIGNYSEIEKYSKALNFFDKDLQIVGSFSTDKKDYSEGDIFDDADAVMFLGEIDESLLISAAKSVKHIFIDDYRAILDKNICKIRALAQEAKITIKVSFPEMYYWGLEDIIKECKEIKTVSFFRECNYLNSPNYNLDLLAEILSTIKLMHEDVIRIDMKNTPILGSESKFINLEFKTGSTATIEGIPSGFKEIHELRISGKDYFACVDLLQREWYLLTKNKGVLEKQVRNLAKIEDVTKQEIQDFINSIVNNKNTLISFDDICSLHNCMELKE